MDNEIGIGSAAKILGISISTLKRLCDGNHIPSIRTPGGHRRFDRVEVELLGQHLVGQYMNQKTVNVELAKQFLGLMINGDEAALDDLILEQLSAGQNLPVIFDQYLLPAVRDVLTGSVDSLPTQQLALHTAVRSAIRFGMSYADNITTDRASATVMGGSVGEPAEELASRCIEATLRSMRIAATHLEGPIDLVHLANTARDLGLHAVWLAALHAETTNNLLRSGNELRRFLPDHVRLFLFNGHRISLEHPTQTPHPALHTSLQTLCLREGLALLD